jgi:hypothetical protein
MPDTFTGIFIVDGNLPQIRTSKTKETDCNETCDLPMEVDGSTVTQPTKTKKRKATIGRKSKAAQNKSKARMNETPEQNLVRLETVRTQQALFRSSETVDQKKDRLQRARSYQEASKLSETIQQKQDRLATGRLQKQALRSSETAKQRMDRVEKVRFHKETTRLNTWKALQKAAFNYDPQTHYDQHPVVKIGNMDTVCPFCRALKWKGETPGMCCSSGKVKLEP